MLFGDNGYYSKRSESPGFVDKLTGIAAIGGIIGSVVLARKPIASALGGMAVSYAKDSQRDIGAVVGNVLETAGRSLLSRSARVYTEGLSGIRTSLASNILHNARVERGFVDFLKDKTDDAGKAILEHQETRRRLQVALTKVSHAKSWGEAAKDITSTRGRRQIHEAVGGIQFQNDLGEMVSLDSHQGIDLIQQAFQASIKGSDVAATRKSMQEFATKNQDTIVSTLLDASNEEAQAVEALQDSLYSKHIVKEITFGEIHTDKAQHNGKSIQDMVNEYFDKVGIRPNRGDKNFGRQLFDNFEKDRDEIFGAGLTDDKE
mgnify:FL=1